LKFSRAEHSRPKAGVCRARALDRIIRGAVYWVPPCDTLIKWPGSRIGMVRSAAKSGRTYSAPGADLGVLSFGKSSAASETSANKPRTAYIASRHFAGCHNAAGHPFRVFIVVANSRRAAGERVIAAAPKDGADVLGANSRISGSSHPPGAIVGARHSIGERRQRRVNSTSTRLRSGLDPAFIVKELWKTKFGCDKPEPETDRVMVMEFCQIRIGKSYFRDVSGCN